MRIFRNLLAGLILIVAPAALAGCTDANGTAEAAEAQGLTNVRNTEHAWFGCGSNDNVRTRFTATNANGQTVTGIACAETGVFGKETTIRGLKIVR